MLRSVHPPGCVGEVERQGVVVGRKVWQRPEDETKWLIAEMAKATRTAFSRRW